MGKGISKVGRLSCSLAIERLGPTFYARMEMACGSFSLVVCRWLRRCGTPVRIGSGAVPQFCGLALTERALPGLWEIDGVGSEAA
jgi:hypothetical protein